MNKLVAQGESQPRNKAALNTDYLNKNQFVLFILKEGLRTGRISKEEMNCFQLQVMDILRDLILRYTRGESTSVTVDAAESILNSVFYCIDTGLKDLNDAESAIETIKSGNIKQIYEKGLELVSACFKESNQLYLSLRKNKLKVGLEAYDLTISESLPGFFEKYGAVFDAHNTIASIDYPLLFDDMSITGIFYIKRYIETLKMETEFCRLFPENDIEKVLTAYGRIYRIDYRKTLTNIFELVLNASIFSVLSGGSAGSLFLSDMQCEGLRGKLDKMDFTQLELIIEEAIKNVISNLNIKDISLIDYIWRYKGVFKTRLVSALDTDSLNKLTLTDALLPVMNHETILIGGERMSNESFRKLCRRLTDGLDTETRISIIRSEIHSLEDFLDILEGGCLFEDEYFHLFSELSNHELGVLARVVFADEVREGQTALSKAIAAGNTAGLEWHQQFVKFLGTLDNVRLESIEDYMNGITNITELF